MNCLMLPSLQSFRPELTDRKAPLLLHDNAPPFTADEAPKVMEEFRNSALTVSVIEHTERTYRLPTTIFSASQSICPPESASNVGETKTYCTRFCSFQLVKRIQRISEKIATTILKQRKFFG
ncbi:hypothetical protein M513_06642 [Trichuris suis]|uniref:Uncharacterized protein n=1 Tax=Trichuris suis TaxID=68888 RepID=A0A085M5E9_9BILA|nr:hypothetical protein M513_06642 [Trichuris suis]